MSLVQIQVDPDRRFVAGLQDLERRQLPFAMLQAINATAFEIRQRWAQVMPRVFDRPTPLTQRAVLYRKATAQKLSADIYIRDEAFKGTPPAKYLLAQVMGGERRAKAFEKRLQAAGILQAGWFAVPGKSANLDAFGNIPGRQMNQVLSQLGARFDPSQNESDESRTRRRKRGAKRGERRGDYFAISKARGRLPAGVYQRVSTAFGSAVSTILHFVPSAKYRPRYQIRDMAQKVFERRFPNMLREQLARAVASARAKGWT